MTTQKLNKKLQYLVEKICESTTIEEPKTKPAPSQPLQPSQPSPSKPSPERKIPIIQPRPGRTTQPKALSNGKMNKFFKRLKNNRNFWISLAKKL